MARDWDDRADVLAAEALAAGRPTSWFDRLYGEGERGEVGVPWDRSVANPTLAEWTGAVRPVGAGARAVVVGCGLGADAEHLASLGFETTAFDVSPTAVRVARDRYPASRVDYRTADLLDLPAQWRGAFDLVVEIFTVQALPDPPRAAAIRGVTSLVAPGGTLFAVAFRHEGTADASTGPPFALSRLTMESLAGDLLEVESVVPVEPGRWRALLHRPSTSGATPGRAASG